MLFQKNESGCLEWEHAPNCLDATDVTLAVARELLVKTPCPIAEAAPLIVKALQRGFEFFFAGQWATQIDFNRFYYSTGFPGSCSDGSGPGVRDPHLARAARQPEARVPSSTSTQS